MIAPPADNSYEAERKMLWQMMFAMREDISRLREEISSGAKEYDRHGSGFQGVRALMASAPEEEAFDRNPLDESERRTIEETLARFGGNKKQAAEALQISVRTLYRKMQDLGIS